MLHLQIYVELKIKAVFFSKLVKKYKKKKAINTL